MLRGCRVVVSLRIELELMFREAALRGEQPRQTQPTAQSLLRSKWNMHLQPGNPLLHTGNSEPRNVGLQELTPHSQERAAPPVLSGGTGQRPGNHPKGLPLWICSSGAQLPALLFLSLSPVSGGTEKSLGKLSKWNDVGGDF